MIKIKRVAVIGAGTMGRQISLQIARNGISVTLFDIDDSVLADAKAAQERIVADWVASGVESENASSAILGNSRYETDLSLAIRAADLAIEAVPERLELKRRVFRQIDGLAREHAIIASNSSSIRISALEDATERPEQVANLHFYLTVWDNPMVEIGGGSSTRDDVLDALSAFARAIGVLPLRVRGESTGFIFNRVWRAIKKEVMKVADSGIAAVEDIDRAWMIKFGREQPPPFAQMDRIGLDVIYDIEMRYAEETGDPDDLPRPILTEKVERGDLGMKTGRGFYNYPDPAYTAEDFLDPDASE
ncbi:MAG: 3-hydroxyacyl-CoA dehydrogenase family protein [Chloroflexi bacterium]|nr:3-hydroxyacyl-CoA dehydrogenase family protein [Chloroflexota bacterium]